MSYILFLPLELLVQIFSYVADCVFINALCLTCKRFAEVSDLVEIRCPRLGADRTLGYSARERARKEWFSMTDCGDWILDKQNRVVYVGDIVVQRNGPLDFQWKQFSFDDPSETTHSLINFWCKPYPESFLRWFCAKVKYYKLDWNVLVATVNKAGLRMLIDRDERPSHSMYLGWVNKHYYAGLAALRECLPEDEKHIVNVAIDMHNPRSCVWCHTETQETTTDVY